MRLAHPASNCPVSVLAAARRASGQRVAVCLPARDEQATVGSIVTGVRTLVDAGLVDEVVVVDDGSTDATARVAAEAGARVVVTGSIDGDVGPGKGEALWTSLAASTADIVCWIDADIVDFDPGFVTRLVGPLVMDLGVDFVKGYYHRPSGDAPTGGGRTTELVARPLLSLFAPDLAEVVQPLSGEYAARRSVLEELPFVQGWGVDIALLIDVAHRVGTGRMAQADLGVRRHRHRPLDQLRPQAMAVLMTVLDRSGVEVPASRALVSFGPDHVREAVVVSLAERPPLALVKGAGVATTADG